MKLTVSIKRNLAAVLVVMELLVLKGLRVQPENRDRKVNLA
jgi:hypothetical protein